MKQAIESVKGSLTFKDINDYDIEIVFASYFKMIDTKKKYKGNYLDVN
tara:strand:- start:24 stop:167 length:144 start_codon:yes stop_codon:yes gene_type:complete